LHKKRSQLPEDCFATPTCGKTAEAGEKKRGNSIFIRSEPSLAALSPFSREMKQLSGEALSRVEPEL